MRLFKATLLLLLGFLLSDPAAAQHTKVKTVKLQDGKQLRLDLPFAQHIEVKGTNTDEARVQLVVEAYRANASDMMRWEQHSTSTSYSLKSVPEWDRAPENGSGSCPDGWMQSSRDDRRLCLKLNYQLEVPADADLHLESISGNINVRGMKRAIYAKSISGYVDMDWPGRKPADVEMKSITGELYTDLDLEWITRPKQHPLVGYLVQARTGEGGDTIHLESVSGNVYLRKAGK